jgi:DNA-directed RNA polymerase alpha subunit
MGQPISSNSRTPAELRLKNNNIVYVGDLVQKTEQDLSRTPNFGRGSMTEIKMVLASNWLTAMKV